MSQSERTGWRDEWISHRHRCWGMPLPINDIDFLICEYKSTDPVAIIEYKEQSSPKHTKDEWQYQAIINLADRANVYCFNVRYTRDIAPRFEITPLNKKAMDKCKRIGLNEIEYVKFLYDLRGIKPPTDLDISGNIGWNMNEKIVQN